MLSLVYLFGFGSSVEIQVKDTELEHLERSRKVETREGGIERHKNGKI